MVRSTGSPTIYRAGTTGISASVIIATILSIKILGAGITGYTTANESCLPLTMILTSIY